MSAAVAVPRSLAEVDLSLGLVEHRSQCALSSSLPARLFENGLEWVVEVFQPPMAGQHEVIEHLETGGHCELPRATGVSHFRRTGSPELHRFLWALVGQPGRGRNHQER